ncbi:MAG: DNA polymerase III subunit epsilon [Rudaea sp.]
MRQIVLDTETTGLEVGKGHRIIEIGCIELAERRPSGRRFHRYLNPQRAVDEGARAVHGISDEFLADKPRFAEVAAEFLAFIDGAELVIHNAAFDVAFLDAELALTDPGLGRVADHARVLDTLALAREKYPGQRISLDALCKRLNIDNRHRELHGALLDAQLLVDVYLAMTGGQGDLGLANAPTAAAPALAAARSVVRQPLRVRRADSAEAFSHEKRLHAIDTASKGRCLWRV